MELLVKPEILTSYIYGPTFGNAETVSFYLLHNVSTLINAERFPVSHLCVNTLPASWHSDRLKCANISFAIHIRRYDESKHERFNAIKDLQTLRR